ncbi:cbb3-type cytochrome oxidase assembly protein CcoS [Lewinella sp. W8]|uniref:cbb3-type cytochrome oxidase assembly protein CcoS n=1 Tax=Lewinella sp. W8 TaxID=2528208 RepID=UPI001067681B|nr:cbb3-type cytochrome oxidase assembly protein CcoS [Lewinella sp. W8]MTB51831.1 cbb3-type cytochrome oxidase assembly protein CcoS [Lewinella sp. W8]
MKVILLLIGLSLVVALIFLAAFFWAVDDGQYEDEVTPSIRMLFDESPSTSSKSSSND